MCKAHIEKSEGCNHMTCYYCEFQFCWICGGTYSYDHYTRFNPFGCSGQQFIRADPATSFLRFFCLYLKRFFMLLGIIILGPIILVFAVPLGLCAACIEGYGRLFRGNCFCLCCFFLFTLPIVLALGFAADAIVVPLAIVIGAPYFIIKQVIEKKRTKRQARERLRFRLD